MAMARALGASLALLGAEALAVWALGASGALGVGLCAVAASAAAVGLAWAARSGI